MLSQDKFRPFSYLSLPCSMHILHSDHPSASLSDTFTQRSLLCCWSSWSRYLPLPPTKQDLTQGQWPESRYCGGLEEGEGRARAEAPALLDYDAARPPEGGPAEVGGLTASSLPLLDCARTSGHAQELTGVVLIETPLFVVDVHHWNASAVIPQLEVDPRMYLLPV